MVRGLVEKICARLGVDFNAAVRNVAERPGQDAAYIIDSSKARSEFGWKPCISLDAGLDETAAWVDRNWESIKDQPTEYLHKK